MNNTSTKGEVKAGVLGKERDTLAAKMTKLEEGFASSKTVVEGKDCCIVLLEKQVANAQSALEQVVEAQNKLDGEKKALEEALCKATLPGEDELEDTASQDRFGLVDKIGELDNILRAHLCMALIIQSRI